jgi:hypothetical protein
MRENKAAANDGLTWRLRSVVAVDFVSDIWILVDSNSKRVVFTEGGGWWV